MTTVNLLVNPGFGTGALAPWTATGATAAVETSIVAAGTYAVQVTPGGTAAGPHLDSGLVPCQPGNWVNVGGLARGSSGLAHQVQAVVCFYTAAGTLTATVAGTAATLTTTGWTTLTATGQAPAGATQAGCRYAYAGTTVPTTSEVSYWDSAWASTLLSWDPQLCRVIIDPAVIAPLLPGQAGTAVISSSPDALRWTVVRGGAAAVVSVSCLPVSDAEFPAPDLVNYYTVAINGGTTYADQITCPLGGTPWLKNIAQPFTNLPVALADASDIVRPARSAAFDIIGQELPVAISTVRGGRQFTLTVYTTTDAADQAVQAVAASGDVLLLQVPAGYATQDIAGYYTAGDTTASRQGVVWPLRWTQIPLTECVPPSPYVVAATSTWQTVAATYPTWAAVVAAQPTWAALIESVGAPADVFIN